VLFALIEQALPEAVLAALRAAVVQAGARDVTSQLGVRRVSWRRFPTGTLARERM
jgi:hypothetical protein